MDISSQGSSNELFDHEWSAVASALPSVFDSAALSDTLTQNADLLEASKIYSLPRVDLDTDTDFEFQPVFLGAGASYRVYMQKFKQWERLVAIKHIKSTVSQEQSEDLPSLIKQRLTVLREMHTLCLFNGHPNVMNLLAWGQYDWGDLSAFLITDYAPLGSLDSFLRENRHSLKVNHLFEICADVAEGIHAMHSQRMIHGDVKTANVLIFEEDCGRGQFTAKISDLGFSISLDFDDQNACYRGTDLYNAPEVRGQGPRRLQDLNLLACDVYSYGLLVWTVFNYGDSFLKGLSNLLVGDSSEEELLDSVGALGLCDHALEFAWARDSQDEAKVLSEVLSACLQVEPVARLSIKTICRRLTASAPLLQVTVKTNFPNEVTKHRFVNPQELDIFDLCRWLQYPPKVKQLLAQKLLSAAENPKNPKGADLAFEVSKCFAIGFGFSKDVQSMEYWLTIAAARGHEFAKALTTKLNIPGAQTKEGEELGSHVVLKPDSTALAIKMKCNRLKAVLDKISMDHIPNFEIYSGGNMVAVESIIQKSISEGLDIDSITGATYRSARNVRDGAKLSLLHWAAWSGRIELVQNLLKFGANINSIEPILHCTPLLVALDAGQIAVAELLLREGADVDEPDHLGQTAIQFLSSVPPDRFSMMVHLLRRASEAAPSRIIRPQPCWFHGDALKDGYSPLYSAAVIGHIQAVGLFLEEIAHDMTAEQFSKAAGYAVMSLHAAVCNIIIYRAFQSFRSLPDNLFCRIAMGSPYRWMLYHGNHWAEALDSTIKILLSHGFDINSYDVNGCTAIDYAVFQDEPVIASTLKAHGASLEQKSRDGLNVLHFAITGVSNSGNVGCVRWLLDYVDPLKPFVPGETSRHKWSGGPLHIASMHNAYGAAKAILEHTKADVNGRSNDGDTPLHIACSQNALEMVQLLLDHGADATTADNHKNTPLEKAVHGISIKVVEYFISRNLSTHNTHSTPPRSILAYYAGLREPGRTRLGQLLLRYTQTQSPEVLHGKDATSRSILRTAVVAKNDDLVVDLIHAGVEAKNPHAPDSEWELLISSYSRIDYYGAGDSRQHRQYLRTVQAFVDCFKQQDLLEACDENGESLLSTAALCSDVAAVTVLLGAGLSARSANNQGSTILHSALFGAFRLSPTDSAPWPVDWLGRQEEVKNRALMAILHLLLNAGADPNAEDIGGVRPLHIAVMAAWRLENTAVVELLCKRGAHPDAPALACYGARPLHIALEAPTFIRAWGVSPSWPPQRELSDEEADAQDAQYLKTMRTLVRVVSGAGASFTPLRDLGIHATAEAIWKCNPIGLRAMLAEGVRVCKALGTGQAACHYAAQWVEAAGKRREKIREPRLIPSSSAWLKARLATKMENMDALHEYRCRKAGTNRDQGLERLPAESQGAESNE